MQAVEFLAKWFGVIILISFLTTALVIELRKRGHLRLGRSMKTWEAMGLLTVLGLSWLIAMPAMTLFAFLYSVAGGLPIVDSSYIAFMLLFRGLPVVAGTVIAYEILLGVKESWGASCLALLLTGLYAVAVFIVSQGWANDVILYIIYQGPMMISYIFAPLLMLVVMGAACTKMGGKAATDSDSKTADSGSQPKVIYTDRVMRLLVGLGKRVTVDGDENALRLLSDLFSGHGQKASAMRRAARECNITIEPSLLTSSTETARAHLAPLAGRYGSLSRRNSIAFGVLVVVACLAAPLTFVLMDYGFLFVLIAVELAAICPVIAAGIYGMGNRYGPDRYLWRPLRQPSAFLLTRAEYTWRVRIDRAVLTFSILVVLFIIISALMGQMSVDVYWPLGGILLLVCTATLAIRDPTVRGRYPSALELAAASAEYMHSAGLDLSDVSDVPEDADQDAKPARAEQVTIQSDEWKNELSQRGFTKFADKLESRSMEIYTEEWLSAALVMPPIALLTVGFFGYLSDWLAFADILILAGVILFILWGFYYYRMQSTHTFCGLQRGFVAHLLTRLDLGATGRTGLDLAPDTLVPTEYLRLLSFRGMDRMALGSAVRKIGTRVRWPSEYADFAKTGLHRMEGVMSFVLGSVMVLFPLLMWDITWLLPEFTVPLMLFVALGFLSFAYGAYKIVGGYRVSRSLVGTSMFDEHVSPRQTMEQILKLLSESFGLPFRVLIVGDYPELKKTGRTYSMTDGSEISESVFIPSQVFPGLWRLH